MCNQTTEEHNVTITHPFTQNIQYNVSLHVPATWSYSPLYQLINATTAGNYTIIFNVTSSNAVAETVVINVTANYTYPNNLVKSKVGNYTVEENNSMPVLEIIRETPRVIANDRVFESQLVVHNKGCAATSGTTTVQEYVSTGWTPANPDIKTNEYGSDVGM